MLDPFMALQVGHGARHGGVERGASFGRKLRLWQCIPLVLIVQGRKFRVHVAELIAAWLRPQAMQGEVRCFEGFWRFGLAFRLVLHGFTEGGLP